MRRRLVVALAAFGALAAPAAAHAETRGYVVVYDGSVAAPAATTNGLERRLGFKAVHRYDTALKGFSARLGEGQAERLRARRGVEAVVPDTTFRAAGVEPVASGESVQPGVRRVGAASLTEVRGPADGAVAVLDTGVDLASADLNAVSGVNCISPGGSARDDNGHGTHVAGIVAARNAGLGVVGVAPGTRLVSVKVLNAKAVGTLSQVLCGIDWVTANAAALDIRVANMSVTASGTNDNNCGHSNRDLEHQAICRSVASGVTYVAAAGNAHTDMAKSIPASYPEVLTVTGMSDTDGLPGARGRAPSCSKADADDRYAGYSNYAVGSVAVAHTLAAPGTCVVSTGRSGGTATYNGTSQAAPHVAATVALCLGSAGVPGPCAGLGPAGTIARVRADASANATLANGFAGDPLRPVKGKYYGPFAWAGGY